MQNVDSPAEIQTLPQPARARRPRVKPEPLDLAPLTKGLDGIDWQCRRRRDIRQDAAVRPPEAKRAVGLSVDLITLLVDRAVMPATEQGEIRQRGRAALGPVADVMPFAEREPAAREATALVPVLECAP